MALVIEIEDPRTTDVVSLLEKHLRFARATSPSCHVHALDIDGLLDASMTFFTARRGVHSLVLVRSNNTPFNWPRSN